MQLSIELCYHRTARVLYTGSATGLTSQRGSSTLRSRNTSLYKIKQKRLITPLDHLCWEKLVINKIFIFEVKRLSTCVTFAKPIGSHEWLGKKISPYNVSTISSRQVIKIKKNITKEIFICWFGTKFSELTPLEFYSRQ